MGIIPFYKDAKDYVGRQEMILRIKNNLHSEQMKVKKITNVKSNILD